MASQRELWGAESLELSDGSTYIPKAYPYDARLVMAARTSVFKSNRSQAVRLPKELAFPEGVKQVAIRKVGKARIILPANAAWDDFFDAPGVDLGDRRQPEPEARESF